jgi:hypothetical protein
MGPIDPSSEPRLSIVPNVGGAAAFDSCTLRREQDSLGAQQWLSSNQCGGASVEWVRPFLQQRGGHECLDGNVQRRIRSSQDLGYVAAPAGSGNELRQPITVTAVTAPATAGMTAMTRR